MGDPRGVEGTQSSRILAVEKAKPIPKPLQSPQNAPVSPSDPASRSHSGHELVALSPLGAGAGGPGGLIPRGILTNHPPTAPQNLSLPAAAAAAMSAENAAVPAEAGPEVKVGAHGGFGGAGGDSGDPM